MQGAPGGSSTNSQTLATQSATMHSPGNFGHWAGSMQSCLPVVIGMVEPSLESLESLEVEVVEVSSVEVVVEVVPGSALDDESPLVDEGSGSLVGAVPELLVGVAVEVVEGSGAPVVVCPVEVDESPVLVVPLPFGLKHAGRTSASARRRPRVAVIVARYHAGRSGCAHMGVQLLSMQTQHSSQPLLLTQSTQ